MILRFFLWVFSISLSALLCSCSNSKHELLAKGIQALYQIAAKSTDSVFLSDSSADKYDFDLNELSAKLPPGDSILLRAILDSGRREIIKPAEVQQMLSSTNVRILSLEQFDQVRMSPPSLTSDEAAIRRKVDSVSIYANEHYQDSTISKATYQELTKLMSDTLFKSSLRKIIRANKRLIYLAPVLTFKKRSLLVMNYFTSISNSIEKAMIIEVD
jgi:hypothetical protein